MSLWQIATRNVWQNRGRYLSYLGSSAFSVMIYFLYTALIYHPELQGGYRGANYALEGMRAASVVIAIFTLLFLLYSNAAFVRSRMKEFGLLTLLGVTKKQLVAILLGESLIVASVAMTTGLGLGLLFLKLFFMAISTLLQLPEQIAFYAGTTVWLQTIGVFGALFLVVSLLSLRAVLGRSIIAMIRAGRQPKGTPTFSRWKAATGLLLLGIGYVWASFPNPIAVVLGIIPVTTLVSVGTVLLMREGSIAFLTWLHNRKSYFYRTGPFLTISQLVFKMQDNYRVLSAVAILVAVILTAMGTGVTAFVFIADEAMAVNPQAIQIIQRTPSEASHDLAQVQQILQKHRLDPAQLLTLESRTAQIADQDGEVTLVPYSFYTAVERKEAETLPLGGEQGAIMVLPYTLFSHVSLPTEPSPAELVIDGERLPITMRSDGRGALLNAMIEQTTVLVLPDERFAQIMAATPADQRLHLITWDSPAWRKAATKAAVTELRTLYPIDGTTPFSSTVEAYDAGAKSVGLVLFIGGFVSLVFFAACCSLLYFRLFTEIEEDRKYYRKLQELGVGQHGRKRLARAQSAVIFFIPFIVGLVHATFAMRALGTLLGKMVLQNGWFVALGYLVLYGLFYAATFSVSWRALQAGQGSRVDAA